MIPAVEIERWVHALLDFHLNMPAESISPIGIRSTRQVPIIGDLILVEVVAEVYKADYAITFRVNKSGGMVSQSIREIM